MNETEHPAEKDATVEYEVWRSGPNLKAADVLLYRGMTEEHGIESLEDCYADKADGYPDAQVEFYLVRATTLRERVIPPGTSAAAVPRSDVPHGSWPRTGRG